MFMAVNSGLFRRVLIATDGSDYTKRAVKYGVELARMARAEIYAVYVVDTAAFASIPLDAAWENMYGLLRKEGEVATKYVEDLARVAGLSVERFVVEGYPGEEIVKLAEEKDADVIVMGTLGKSGLDRFLLGSVAEKVTRISKVPVMVVRAVKNEE